MNLKNEDVKLLQRITSVLYDWSGATDDTSDDTILIAGTINTITLGDLRDVSVLIEAMKSVVK